MAIDPVLYAIPVFVVLLVLEALSFRYLRDEDGLGYEVRDTATSLSMGLGNVAVNAVWKGVVLAAYTGLYALSPWQLDPTQPWVWVALFFADDFCYYWFHRVHHEVRLFWASHVVHHSSQRYNLSTALRQTWTPMTGVPFWAVLPLLGFPPWMVFFQQGVSLVYQFFIHTERVDRLPRPVEWVFNTPSHHRVHHASNAIYLDRNYAGILIVWDRLFGTFEPERERVVYGLTSNIATHNPARVAFHEFAAIARDVVRDPRHTAGYLLRGPGWRPE